MEGVDFLYVSLVILAGAGYLNSGRIKDVAGGFIKARGAGGKLPPKKKN